MSLNILKERDNARKRKLIPAQEIKVYERYIKSEPLIKIGYENNVSVKTIKRTSSRVEK